MGITSQTLTATMGAGYRVTVQSGNHTLTIDQPKPAGQDAGPNPLELMFAALAGCMCTIARIMAQQRRLELRGMEVRVDGDIDKAVLLGKSAEGRAGFTFLKITAKIDADLSASEKLEFLREVEKRCPVSDNLAVSTPVECEVIEE